MNAPLPTSSSIEIDFIASDPATPNGWLVEFEKLAHVYRHAESGWPNIDAYSLLLLHLENMPTHISDRKEEEEEEEEEKEEKVTRMDPQQLRDYCQDSYVAGEVASMGLDELHANTSRVLHDTLDNMDDRTFFDFVADHKPQQVG